MDKISLTSRSCLFGDELDNKRKKGEVQIDMMTLSLGNIFLLREKELRLT